VGVVRSAAAKLVLVAHSPVQLAYPRALQCTRRAGQHQNRREHDLLRGFCLPSTDVVLLFRPELRHQPVLSNGIVLTDWF
jgi:hypothetical protein